MKFGRLLVGLIRVLGNYLMMSSLLLGKTIFGTQTNKILTKYKHKIQAHIWLDQILLILPTECAPLCMN